MYKEECLKSKEEFLKVNGFKEEGLTNFKVLANY
jgi:hypothetical protein